MKICFVYSSFFRHGGVQRVCSKIINYLSQKHEIDVVCNEQFDIKNNYYNIDLSKVNIIHKDVLMYSNKNYQRRRNLILRSYKKFPEKICNILNNIYYEKKTKKQMIDFINSRQYDIVIGCSMEFNLLLGSISKQINSYVIGWEHNEYDFYFENDRFLHNQKNLCKHLLSKLDQFIVLTKIDREKYLNNLDLESTIVPNPVTFISNAKSENKNKVILSVGRLEYNKGIDLLIESFDILIKRLNIEWKLIIVGEGPLYKDIKKLIQNRNLDKYVELIPFTNDIKSYYLNSSIYACSSRYESFGLTVLEAMECGLPVVSFNTSGPLDIIRNEIDGFIIEKFDIEKYTNKLYDLIIDSENRQKLSINSINRAKEYREDRIYCEWENIIRTAELKKLQTY